MPAALRRGSPARAPERAAGPMAGRGIAKRSSPAASPPSSPPSPSSSPSPSSPPTPCQLTLLSGKDLTVGEEIGKGRFKQVHRGLLQDKAEGPHDIVVLRFLKGTSESKNELEVLTLLAKNPGSPPYVPKVFGAIDERRTTVVLQERAKFGSLKSALSDPEIEPGLSIEHRIHAAAQVSQAMDFLQSVRIVHADLSCRNVLLCRLEEDPSAVRVKISDFGLAIVLKEGADFEIRKQPQATRWCSPETVACQRLSFQSDMWSLGATLWEFFTGGELPWNRWDKRSLVAARLRALAEGASTPEVDLAEEFPPPAGLPELAYEAVMSCLQVDENARPKARDLGGALLRAVARPAALEASASASALPGSELPASREADVGTPSTAASPPEFAPNPACWQKCRHEQEGLGTAGLGLDGLAGLAKVEALGTQLLDELILLRTDERDQALAQLVARFMKKVPKQLMRRMAQQLTAAADAGPVAVRPPWEPEAPRNEAEQTAGRLPRDVLLPLYPNGAPASTTEAFRPCGAWTLQTLVGHATMRHQEFTDEQAAWAAFRAAGDTPSMLRDPMGFDAAARSWLVVSRCSSPMPRSGSPMQGPRSSFNRRPVSPCR